MGFIILGSFGSGFSILGLEAYKTGTSHTLTVVPLFILMGQFVNTSRMGADIYQTVYQWIGFYRGARHGK